jgi:hypothetical protein
VKCKVSKLVNWKKFMPKSEIYNCKCKYEKCYLNTYLKKLEKEYHIKLTETRRKKIKIKADINEIQRKIAIERINISKVDSFKGIIGLINSW